MFFLYFVPAYQLTGLISNFSFRSQSGIEAESRDFRASAEGSTSVDPSVGNVVLVPARLHRVQRSRPYVPVYTGTVYTVPKNKKSTYQTCTDSNYR